MFWHRPPVDTKDAASHGNESLNEFLAADSSFVLFPIIIPFSVTCQLGSIGSPFESISEPYNISRETDSPN